MAAPRAGGRGVPDGPARRIGRGLLLAFTFLLALGAVLISAGLVVYTAWRHDLQNGPFALAFAVLSTRAALSWRTWQSSYQQLAVGSRQQGEDRKPADESYR